MPQIPQTLLNILLIEDNEADSYVVRRILEKNFDRPCKVTEVSCMKDAEVLLVGRRQSFDAVLLDLGLPDTLGGRDTYARLEAANRGLPVIILSNLENHEVAVKLVEDGASDFVRKALMAAMPEALCDVISFAVCRQKNIAATQGEMDRQLELKNQVIDWMSGGYSVRK